MSTLTIIPTLLLLTHCRCTWDACSEENVKKQEGTTHSTLILTSNSYPYEQRWKFCMPFVTSVWMQKMFLICLKTLRQKVWELNHLGELYYLILMDILIWWIYCFLLVKICFVIPKIATWLGDRQTKYTSKI